MAEQRMTAAMLILGMFTSSDPARSQTKSDLENAQCLAAIQSSIVGAYEVEGQNLNGEGSLAPFWQTIRIESPSEGTLTYFDDDTRVGTWRLAGNKYSFVSYGPQGHPAHHPFEVSFDCRRSNTRNRTVLVEEWRTPTETATNKAWEFRQQRIFTPGSIEGVIAVREVGSHVPHILINTYVATLRVTREPLRTQQ